MPHSNIARDTAMKSADSQLAGRLLYPGGFYNFRDFPTRRVPIKGKKERKKRSIEQTTFNKRACAVS